MNNAGSAHLLYAAFDNLFSDPSILFPIRIFFQTSRTFKSTIHHLHFANEIMIKSFKCPFPILDT